MMWVDYTINSLPGGGFRVEGDWPGEVMGLSKDGKSKDRKENPLYSPGDVFIVNEDGWLIKSDELSAMVLKYDKQTKTTQDKAGLLDK
jgi:hypothetical protein|tara:strand:+ start:1067 stop:1330 length:264 start_codon:yes stop_codon:yes gene_type:complete